MHILKLKSPAKINLTLKIEDKRSDNYHNLTTIIQTINLFDYITLKKSNSFDCYCSDKNIPQGYNNLAAKAAIAFFRYTNLNSNVSIHIHKNIPSQAGLGGGSSNAAYVLIGLNKLFKTNLKKTQLIHIAQNIGSDVPFFIIGNTVLVRGKGNILTKLKPMRNCNILIIKPKNLNISTKQAFDRHDLMAKNDHIKSSSKIDSIKKIILQINNNVHPLNYCHLFFNDFDLNLSYKLINDIKYILQKSKAACYLMTGSGSSIFSIFKNSKDLKQASFLFPDDIYFKYICKPI